MRAVGVTWDKQDKRLPEELAQGPRKEIVKPYANYVIVWVWEGQMRLITLGPSRASCDKYHLAYLDPGNQTMGLTYTTFINILQTTHGT